MNKNYLIVPIELLDHLKNNELLILSQIAYLKKSFNTITASNDFFASKLNLSVPTVSRAIRTLERFNYITIHYDFKEKNKTKRIILLTEKSLTIYGLHHTKIAKKTLKTKKTKVLEQFLKD